MACTIVTTPSVGASDWTSWITQQGLTDRGFMRVSLTNFAGTVASAIGTGSVFECAGSIYSCTETAISLATGTASASVAVYIMAIPAAAGTTCTFELNSVAPTWIDSKQGFYASAASVTRAIGGMYIGTVATYYDKWLYDSNAGQDMPIGTIWMFDGTHWVDNFTIPGWYACIAANAGQGCPDMVDKFVMGKVVAGAGDTGGNNTIVDHIHGIQSASHYHFLAKSAIYTATLLDTNYLATRNDIGNDDAYLLKGHTDIPNVGKSGNQSVSHTHGSGSAPGSTDSRPAYYSMIFIRKCA